MTTALCCSGMPSREASLRNLEKAKAHWRAPQPWRCAQESRLIKRLAWQYFIGVGPRCSLRGLARRLGVSLMYVQKLRQHFKVHPEANLGRVVPTYSQSGISASGQLQTPFVRVLATFEELRNAQAQSERMRQRGQLRRSFRGRPWPRRPSSTQEWLFTRS